MKNNNKILYISIAILVLAVGIAFGTYAYYQTTITGTISGNVSKWSFKANNQTSTFNLDFGALYPGKTGEYAIELSAEDSELPVAFELIFHWPEVLTASFTFNSPAEAEYSALLANIFFDSSYTFNTEFDQIVGFKGIIMQGEKVEIPLYYYWNYEHREDIDSMSDNTIYAYIGDQNLSLPVTIVGRQVDISSDQAAYSSAFGSDLLGIINKNNCSNGTYAYSNLYGYPCEFFTFTVDLSAPPLFGNINFDDLSNFTYTVWPIKWTFSE